MSLLKRLLKQYLYSTWLPSTLLLSYIFLYYMWHSHLQNIYVVNGSIWLGVALLASVVISSIINIRRKKYISGIIGLSFVSILVSGIVLAIILFIAIMLPGKDNFADQLVIPINLHAKLPKENPHSEYRLSIQQLLALKKASESIVLCNGTQPGMYQMAAWLDIAEPGELYVKAYEVTRNIPLSTDMLYKATLTKVPEKNEKYVYDTSFTIYEGDWDKPYAARFEIWFKPDSNKPEKKLAEDTYSIYGWQR